MISDELQNLLSLLAVTIFADKRVFAQEIETFLKTAESITEIRNVEETLSEAKLGFTDALISWPDLRISRPY